MPRLQSLFNVSFVKGLVTEAGELTFPENASVDELNCTLLRTGNRRRRLGVSTEALGSTYSGVSEGRNVSTGTWENVGGEDGVEFTVVQVGSTLVFYDKASETLSDGIVPTSDSDATPYTVNLSLYNRPGGRGASQDICEFTSVKGALVVTNPEINSIYIERDTSDNSFSVTEIAFKARDYEWIGDTSTYYATETRTRSSLNWLREYDTRNAGWIKDEPYNSSNSNLSAPYVSHIQNGKGYPPLTVPWYAAKNSDEQFVHTTYTQLTIDGINSLGANGHFILDLYEGDRAAALAPLNTSAPMYDQDTDTSQIPAKAESTRFSCCAAYAGRVFFAGMSSARNTSRIYYSQTLESLDRIGLVHTINDPTSENYSDPLDTDGGFVDIEEAYGIKKLYAIGNTLMIFASNGVWALDGVDGVFRSTEYRVNKMSDVGIVSPKSFAALDNIPFWWSVRGIYSVVANQVGDKSVENISLGSIQTFFDNISPDLREQVRAEVDEVQKRIYWFYPKEGETSFGKLNRVLVLDGNLEAFYPWEISDQSSNTKYIIGTSFYKNSSKQEVSAQVIDGSGNTVTAASGVNDVKNTSLESVTGSGTQLKVLVWDPVSGGITWGDFSDTDFLDWGDTNYSSYAEARHDMMGDLNLRKTAPYITLYLGLTETGWEASGDEYVPVREGSCLVSAYWDWKTTSSSGTQQGYRYKTTPVVDTGDLTDFGYPSTIIQTRLKLRGRGRSMRVRIESEQGKDFNLIGWGMIGAVNDRP